MVKKIILYFKNLLSLSYSEARGFLSLVIVCVAALILISYPELVIFHHKEISKVDEHKLDSMVTLLKKNQSGELPLTYFNFNPNYLPVDSLVLLGFPQKVAERLQNYRVKGGRFYRAGDVKKIYRLSDELYEAISPYIQISEKQKNVFESFDLNKVDVTQLKSLSGIGETYAYRIISYRDLLGGYIDINQLTEVYQLSEEALESLKTNSFVRKNYKPGQLKINHATVEELGAHPYISRRLAEDIVRYREINGAIESEKLLASFKSLDKGNFQKLISYLDFQ